MDNPYQSPATAPAAERADEQPGVGSLVLRLVILAFCSAQFLALLWHRGEVWEALRTGMVSPFGVAASFLFAFVLLLAGVLLFFSRRSALWLLLACLSYQLYRIVTAQGHVTQLLCILSFVCIAGCLVYCWRLKRRA